MGTRVRARGLAQGEERAGSDREPHGGVRPDREGSGGILSRHLLVVDAEDPGPEPVSGHGPQRYRHAGGLQDPRAVAQCRAATGCRNRHQLGGKATREIPAALGTFEKSIDAWQRRLLSGPAATSMAQFIALMNTADGGHIRRLAEWTDRIKAGELPASAPPRPHGVERNLVVTVYDWLSPKYYLHDLTTTDRRKPTVNPYGLIYGAAELSTDDQAVFDPVKITKSVLKVPLRDADAPSSALANKVGAPSPYFGAEQVWDSRVNAHNPMMDHEGRVYYTAQSRSPKHPPAYCAAASGHPSAKVYPLT